MPHITSAAIATLVMLGLTAQPVSAEPRTGEGARANIAQQAVSADEARVFLTGERRRVRSGWGSPNYAAEVFGVGPIGGGAIGGGGCDIVVKGSNGNPTQDMTGSIGHAKSYQSNGGPARPRVCR